MRHVYRPQEKVPSPTCVHGLANPWPFSLARSWVMSCVSHRVHGTTLLLPATQATADMEAAHLRADLEQRTQALARETAAHEAAAAQLVEVERRCTQVRCGPRAPPMEHASEGRREEVMRPMRR